MNKIHSLFLILLSTLILQSCLSPKKLMNFTEGPEFTTIPDSILNRSAIRIQAGDVLSIGVFNSHDVDPKVVAPFNLGFGQERADKDQENTASAYRVDLDGNIQFPVLGPIPTAGRTIPEIRDVLSTKLRTYLNAPIVNIRLVNFRFTVLGEVADPGTYTVGEEGMHLLEALGMAGDLTSYGNRENILIIREQNGARTFSRINLHERNVFASPYFYLRQNDVIYIEPLKEKSYTIATRTQQILPWVSVAAAILNVALFLAIRG